MGSFDPDMRCMRCFAQLNTRHGTCPVCGFCEDAMVVLPHPLRPRTILGGKYLLGKVLGEGGFGITYIGWDLNLATKVAIKEFYPSGCVTREAATSSFVHPYAGKQGDFFHDGRERFVNEAQILARFRGRAGIVIVSDYFAENNTAYIVMEYVEGETLKDHLALVGDRMPAERVFALMQPVMASLADVHAAGVIHRDISPDNIMLTSDGSVKLIDFGAARAFAQSGDESMSVLLKKGYAPEEQYRSKGKQGPWTDVYALSATMYRAITGITPDEALERVRYDAVLAPSALRIPIDALQEEALMTGMAVYQEGRFQSVTALEVALYHKRAEPGAKRSGKGVGTGGGSDGTDASGDSGGSVGSVDSQGGIETSGEPIPPEPPKGRVRPVPPSDAKRMLTWIGENKAVVGIIAATCFVAIFVMVWLTVNAHVGLTASNAGQGTVATIEPTQRVAITAMPTATHTPAPTPTMTPKPTPTATPTLPPVEVIIYEGALAGMLDEVAAHTRFTFDVNRTSQNEYIEQITIAVAANTRTIILDDPLVFSKSANLQKLLDDWYVDFPEIMPYQMYAPGYEQDEPLLDEIRAGIRDHLDEKTCSFYLAFKRNKRYGTTIWSGIPNDWGLRRRLDDRVYFINSRDRFKLYCKVDGDSELTKLCDDETAYLILEDDWVYYVNLSDGGGVYRIFKDGSKKTKLTEDRSCKDINISSQGSVLYIGPGKDRNAIYKMSLDGVGKTVYVDGDVIGKTIGGFTLSKKGLYYYAGGDIYFYTSSTGESTLQYSGNVNSIEALGDYLYFTDDAENNSMFRMHLDTLEVVKICDDNCYCMSFIPNGIAYRSIKDNQIHKIAYDGSAYAEN